MSQDKRFEHPFLNCKYWSCLKDLVFPQASGISGWELASSLAGAGVHLLQMLLQLVQRWMLIYPVDSRADCAALALPLSRYFLTVHPNITAVPATHFLTDANNSHARYSP